VKQIVGGSLRDAPDGKGDDEQTLTTNFVAEHPPSYYAELYARHNLIGGHIIKLGAGNDEAAISALQAWPDRLHIGGGIDADNARLWLERGAEKVIVTSYLFPDCKFSFERLLTLEKIVGRDRLGCCYEQMAGLDRHGGFQRIGRSHIIALLVRMLC